VRPLSTLGNREPLAASAFVVSSTWPSYGATTITLNFDSLIEARIRSSFAAANRELERYALYPARWDGYRANPFADDVLKNATGILEYAQKVFEGTGIMPELVTTGPASDGSVDVEFRVGSRRLMMTLYPRENVVRIDHGGGRNDEAPLGGPTLERWIGWVHGSSALPADLATNPTSSR
jgi:hypothetical protein